MRRLIHAILTVALCAPAFGQAYIDTLSVLANQTPPEDDIIPVYESSVGPAGTGACDLSTITNVAAGDLLIASAETSEGEIWGDGTNDYDDLGYTQLGESTTTGTTLVVWYKIASGGGEGVDWLATVNAVDAGDHQICRLSVYTAGTFDAADPFNNYTESTDADITSTSIAGVTTTRNNSMIVYIAGGSGDPASNCTDCEWSSSANATLTGFSLVGDRRNSGANGGSQAYWQGSLATAGATGTTTATAATAGTGNYIVFAINPGTTP